MTRSAGPVVVREWQENSRQIKETIAQNREELERRRRRVSAPTWWPPPNFACGKRVLSGEL
jgi:hypothetical protein